LAACKPNYDTIKCFNQTITGYIYNPIYTGDGFCTGDPDEVKEARLSFPSGHSSFSFYCMGFLIIYLEARLHLLKFRYIKPLIQIGAFMATLITCLSRISDYHHRGSDVAGGIAVGLLVAIVIVTRVGGVLWHFNRKKPTFEFSMKTVRV
jgi:phosphatidate phosphatase